MSGMMDFETGGGAAVAFATQAEAVAGTNNAKAMTPLRVAEAIAALGGGVGGSDGAGLPLTFVDATAGDDTTGEGTMGAPYATVQRAYDGGARHFSVRGAVGDLTVAAGGELIFMGYGKDGSQVGVVTTGWNLRIVGNGRQMVSFQAVHGRVAAGSAAGPGVAVVCATVRDDVSSVGANGVDGAYGSGGAGEYDSGGRGGDGTAGGNGGAVTVEDAEAGALESLGGNGGNGGGGGAPGGTYGNGGDGGNGGAGGSGGVMMVVRSNVGTAASSGGAGGTGGEGGSGPVSGTTGSSGTSGEAGLVTVRFSEVQAVSSPLQEVVLSVVGP